MFAQVQPVTVLSLPCKTRNSGCLHTLAHLQTGAGLRVQNPRSASRSTLVQPGTYKGPSRAAHVKNSFIYYHFFFLLKHILEQVFLQLHPHAFYKPHRRVFVLYQPVRNVQQNGNLHQMQEHANHQQHVKENQQHFVF